MKQEGTRQQWWVGVAGVSRGRRLLLCTGWTCSRGTVSAQKSFLKLLIIRHVSLLSVVASNIRIMVELFLYSLFPTFSLLCFLKKLIWKYIYKRKCQSLNHVQRFATHELQPVRLLYPWNSLGKNTGVGSLSLSRVSSQSRDQTQVSHISGGFFTSWATREAQICWSSVSESHSVVSDS